MLLPETSVCRIRSSDIYIVLTTQRFQTAHAEFIDYALHIGSTSPSLTKTKDRISTVPPIGIAETLMTTGGKGL